MEGRPLKFKTPEELETKITEYFESCKEHKRPLTISGLAFALDTNRQTLINYSRREEFFDTIKRAKVCIEAFVEEQLFRNGQVAGIIFNLKNNFNWKDEVRFNQTEDRPALSDAQREKILSLFRKVTPKEVEAVVVPNAIRAYEPKHANQLTA